MSFRDLKIWQRAIEFNSMVYLLTRDFPKEETFNLTSQLRRASVSVASNIAEGSSRSSAKDFERFIEIAIGGLMEIQTQLIISEELGYIDNKKSTEAINESDELIKMLYGFKASLTKKNFKLTTNN